MEDIAKVLKIFLEEHLIPAVVALVLTLLTITFLPKDFWVISKIGIEWFRVLLFGIYFLVTQLCVYLLKTAPAKASKRRYEKLQKEKQQQEAIKSWQNVFDHLTQYEIDIVKELVENNNTPVKREYMFGSEIHSDFLGMQYRDLTMGGLPFVGKDDFQNGLYICTVTYEEDKKAKERKAYRVYKLQDDAYNVAKYILETKGRLSTYEEVEKNA